MTRPLRWLQYIEASSVMDKGVSFKGLSVEGPSGTRLGEVDGFVLDAASLQPYYVAVDARGWFKSRHFLLPIGHTQLDGDRLVTHLSRDRIERFPGFEWDRFETLSDESWKHFNNQTCQACTTVGVSIVYAVNEPAAATFKRSDYTCPDWWNASPTSPEHRSATELAAGARYPLPRPSAASGRSHARHVGGASGSNRTTLDRSPQGAGQTQPGAAHGVEIGGERTHAADGAGQRAHKERRRAEAAARRTNH